jgi:signal transduction histidine kinase/FixJ family two-component response regulator
VFTVLTCIYGQHDLRLVVVAAIICVVAAGTAFGFHLRSLKNRGALQWAWLGLTGLVAGSGVWATHFIAMLAYRPSLPIGYDALATAASLLAAVVGMGVGFALPVWRPGRAMGLAGGAFTGLSVAVMHFMGIGAMRTQAYIQWDHRYVLASVLIGVGGGMAAFALRGKVKGAWDWAPPAGLLVLGICGLHFTAMAAVQLWPDSSISVPAELIDRGALALATGGLAALILLAAFSLLWMERLGQRSTLSGLRQALDAVPSGLGFFDPADRLMTWNAAYAAILEACGLAAVVGLPRSAVEAGLSDRASDADRGGGSATEWRLQDGRWIRYEACATQDGRGVTVLTDVTEQKQSAADMAAARESAEAANRAKSAFLANMSHEIRTPLNGVLGIADALMRERLNGRQRKLVAVIQQSGGLLNGLLTDLLDLAQSEAGVARLRIEDALLGELVGQVAGLFQARAAEKGLKLTAEVGPGADGQVACDPMRLSQVLGNLVSNAVKFTDAGEVVLAVTRAGDQVRFEVRDTGVGVDAAAKARIFQRFGQADSSATRKQGGAGLGLAICAEYTRLMGGKLDCDSVPGAGSVFHFTLAMPLRGVAASGPGDSVEGVRVLIVDDNAVNRQVLELILDSAGFEHVSVENGAEAVEAVARCGFDAVLMDLQMPVMDGLEATRRIRAWEIETGRGRTPILVVSANGLNEHVEAARAAGADDHLHKPISVAVLLTTLQRRLAGTLDDAQPAVTEAAAVGRT